MKVYACDLAISAVASDGSLVHELSAELSARLPMAPEWSGGSGGAEADGALRLSAAHSRVALVLHQQLWRRDVQALCDAEVLRTRGVGRRGSVCVIALDDALVDSWLIRAPRYALSQSGRGGVVEFVVGVVATAGGAVNAERPPAQHEPMARWPEPPAPFLAQSRAHSALRRELDRLVALLRHEVERARRDHPERSFEVRVLPYRVIARLDDVAVSFSWMPGRRGTVSDGRLLVIAWRELASVVSGAAPLKAAVPFYEREYVPDRDAPGDWCWRTMDVAHQPYASAQLVADWIARLWIARAG